jgi:flagellar hook-associated protein 2
MGSPITFSGFNNIDFGSILNTIMTAERIPLTALETQKTTLNQQGTAFTTLASKLGALESAVDTLADSDGFDIYAATSGTPENVGVSTTSGGVAGLYEVVVSELAHAQVMASTTTYASPDEVIATGGSLSVALYGNPPVNIPPTAIAGSMTVRQLADAINADANSPVNAAVVQAAPGQYRLVLTGRSTGSANAFTVTSTLSGGTGLVFTDTDNDGTYGDDAADSAVSATNATLTINNIPITSASNTLEDAIPGVIMTLSKKDPTKTVLVEVTESADEAQSQLDEFVKAYNELMSFMTEQNTAALAGKASISRDSLVRSLKMGLTSSMRAEYLDGAPTYTRLGTVGIEFNVDGTIKLDSAKLKAAVLDDPNAIRKLFVGATGTGGVFGALKAQVEDYTKAGGLVQDAKDRLKDQIVKIDAKLDTMEMQLELRRQTLQREFIAADQLMSQLNGQGSSLQALGGQYRLF